MAYDPFVRGPFPVGVRSGVLIDPQRDQRRLPFELWYPATPRYADLDLHPLTQDAFVLLSQAPPLRQAAVRDAAVAPGRYPLVLFSHASYGHRRQSTFVCTHLASPDYSRTGLAGRLRRVARSCHQSSPGWLVASRT